MKFDQQLFLQCLPCFIKKHLVIISAAPALFAFPCDFTWLAEIDEWRPLGERLLEKSTLRSRSHWAELSGSRHSLQF